MKIEKTDMEFVTFDAQDVIMTSTPGGGGGHDDDAVSVIWLINSSVENFNAFDASDIDLAVDANNIWSSYTGNISTQKITIPGVGTFDVTTYTISTTSNEKPEKGIYVVNANNEADYNAVLTWLKNHSKQ